MRRSTTTLREVCQPWSPEPVFQLSWCFDIGVVVCLAGDSAAVVCRQFSFFLFYFYLLPVLLPRLVWMAPPLVTQEQVINNQRNLDFCLPLFAFVCWFNVSSWSTGLCKQFFLSHVAIYKWRPSKIQDPGFVRNHRAIAAGFTFVAAKIAGILVS